MLFHVALVSMTREVTLANLASVSAAFQKLVSRDFGPIWNFDATVDAFDKLEDVPVGYWHVLLKDELSNGAAGVHAPAPPGSGYVYTKADAPPRWRSFGNTR